MSETVPGAPGGVVPRIPRGRTSDDDDREREAIERVGGTVATFVDEKIREARIVGFAAGVIVGVAWMLVVLFAADRLVG